jgi:hypothetical protein
VFYTSPAIPTISEPCVPVPLLNGICWALGLPGRREITAKDGCKSVRSDR